MAAIVFREFAITVRVNGVALLTPPTASDKPVGTDWKFSVAVRGLIRTLAVLWRPPASVAVRRISICDGYRLSGATNEPLATPVTF